MPAQDNRPAQCCPFDALGTREAKSFSSHTVPWASMGTSPGCLAGVLGEAPAPAHRHQILSATAMRPAPHAHISFPADSHAAR